MDFTKKALQSLFDNYNNISSTTANQFVDAFWALYTGSGGGPFVPVVGDTDILSADAVLSVSIGSRILYDDNGFATVDYKNRQLKQASGNVVMRWDSTLMSDGGGNLSVDWSGRLLYDDTGSLPALDWFNRRLYDSNNFISIDWHGRTLEDATGAASLGYNNRILYDSTGIIAGNWATRTLTDNSDLDSILWRTRNLIAADGATVMMDWSNPGQVAVPAIVAANGYTGSFLTGDARTATVVGGIITNVA